MSRIRSVHPGFFTDENLVTVSMAARLLFIGIGTEADDKGTFEWKPLTIKMRIFPADNVDVAELLSELVGADALRQYEVAGRKFGAIRNFRRFQKPKTPNDINPAPVEILAFVGLASEPRPVDDAPFPPKGETFPPKEEIAPQMEDGGEDGEEDPPAPQGVEARRGKILIPEDWEAPAVTDLPPKARACAEQWSTASYETHAEAFRLYWRSERKMKADWRGTWANRVISLHSQVLRDQKFGNAAPDGFKAPADPNAGTLLRRYQAGEISFEEFNEARRSTATGPPRSIGQIVRGLSAAAQ